MKVLGIITTDENATKSDDNISTAPGGERQQPVPGQRSRCQARKVGGKVCGAMPSTVAQIVDLIRSKSEAGCTLAVERSQPMPKQGVTSVFTYGQHYGILEAIAACLMMAYTSIRPVEWKRPWASTVIRRVVSSRRKDCSLLSS